MTFQVTGTQSIYQLHGNVADLQQAIAVSEPGLAGLFIPGLGLLGLAVRRRGARAQR